MSSTDFAKEEKIQDFLCINGSTFYHNRRFKNSGMILLKEMSKIPDGIVVDNRTAIINIAKYSSKNMFHLLGDQIAPNIERIMDIKLRKIIIVEYDLLDSTYNTPYSPYIIGVTSIFNYPADEEAYYVSKNFSSRGTSEMFCFSSFMIISEPLTDYFLMGRNYNGYNILRNLLISHFKIPTPSKYWGGSGSYKKKLLIISRPYTRKLVQDSDIQLIGFSLGYDAIIADFSTYKKLGTQFDILAKADVIIGIHGMELTAVFTMNKSAYLIELMGWNRLEMNHVGFICYNIGLNCTQVFPLSVSFEGNKAKQNKYDSIKLKNSENPWGNALYYSQRPKYNLTHIRSLLATYI